MNDLVNVMHSDEKTMNNIFKSISTANCIDSVLINYEREKCATAKCILNNPNALNFGEALNE